MTQKDETLRVGIPEGSGDQQGGAIDSETSAMISPETEDAALGALIWAPPQIADEILAAMADDDFAVARNRFIVSVVRRMRAEDLVLDPMSIAAYIEVHGLLSPGPGRTHLRSQLALLASDAPIPLSGPFLARAVVTFSHRRRIAAAAEELHRIATLGDGAGFSDLVRGELLALLDALDDTRIPEEVTQ